MADDSQTGLIPVADPLVGQEISGTYRIVRQVGQGGMGSVYEAKHVRLPKKFAIKVMHPDVAADQVSFERFRREAETTSTLGNAHIAEVMDFNFLPDGSPYMVMEFLEGEDLGSRIDSKKSLPHALVAEIIADVASALASAHAKGIFHRDIKPANVFLARQQAGADLVKLLDFGAAKSKSKRNANLTMAGQVLGTPWYMSPEQARGQELDARSDEFSLAVVAYEALTGQLPFESDDPVQVLFRIVEEPYIPIRSRVPELPERVEDVIGMALEKAPDDRYAGVVDFATALRQALGAPAPPGVGRRSVSSAQATRVLPALDAPPARQESAARESPSRDTPPIPARTAHDTPADAPAVNPRADSRPAASTDPGRSSRAALVLGIVGALLALGIGAALWMTRSGEEPPPPAPPPPKVLVPAWMQTPAPPPVVPPTGATGPVPDAAHPAGTSTPARGSSGAKRGKGDSTRSSHAPKDKLLDLGPDP